MKHKTISVDFGLENKEIQVPHDAVIAEFSEPEALINPEITLEAALKAPFGSPPFEALIKPNMTVAIGFDDPTRPPAAWQLILPNIVQKLLKHGVNKKDILLICANGNHKKWTRLELKNFVGEYIFDQFWKSEQLINHDCVKQDNLKYLGHTRSGCRVEHNKSFVEADLMIYVGQVMVNSWGGYTGTGAVVGLASTRSIMSHHDHSVVNHPTSTLGDHRSMHFRKLKAEINAKIEDETEKRIFYINYVGGTGGEISNIFAGFSPEIEEPAWAAADKFSIVNVPQADVFVIGLTDTYAYGSSNNPLIAAIGMAYPTRVWLGDHLLKKGGVLIGLTPSSGYIDPAVYPSYQEVLDLAGKEKNMHNLIKYQQDIAIRTGYIEQYKQGGAYHPIHPFWLLYSCDYAFSRASKVMVCGSKNQEQFAKMGIETIDNFALGLSKAREIVGKNPQLVVAPSYWSRRTFKFKVN